MLTGHDLAGGQVCEGDGSAALVHVRPEALQHGDEGECRGTDGG